MQLVEFLRIKRDGSIAGIALGKEKLCGAFYSRRDLGYVIDLALPSTTEQLAHYVLARKAPAGYQRKAIYVHR